MSSYGLEVLDRPECEALLRTERVGRVALDDADSGLAILPIVYGVIDGDIVFRTAPGAQLIAAALHRTVVFEVDAYDAARGSGWSVNVVGACTEIVHPGELARANALELPAWAGEVRDRYVRIEPESVSGRRLVGAIVMPVP
jgi:nitroimidazol reductase NimA-like FMN-containing flavoprotein (pyridoxamine 5'-phosphate oxidase superfamily)